MPIATAIRAFLTPAASPAPGGGARGAAPPGFDLNAFWSRQDDDYRWAVLVPIFGSGTARYAQQFPITEDTVVAAAAAGMDKVFVFVMELPAPSPLPDEKVDMAADAARMIAARLYHPGTVDAAVARNLHRWRRWAPTR